MDGHEFNVLFGAVNYLSMYPLMLAAPWVWAMIFFVDYESTFTDPNVKSIEAVFLMLLAVVSPSYLMCLFGPGGKRRDFYDVTVAQRMGPVALVVLATGLLGQDPFEGRNMCVVMSIVDVGGGVAHGLTAPGGLGGVFGRVWTLFKNTPKSPFHKALRVEAYVGMTYGFMAMVYAGVVTTETKLAVMITMLSTLIVYIWIWFNAVSQGETPATLLTVHRLCVIGALLFHSERVDFGELNLAFRLMAAALGAAIVSPYLGALVSGLSALLLYKETADYVFTVENGPLLFLVGMGGVLTCVTSYGWLFLFYDGYDDKQKARVLRTHWQDRILGLFCVAVGAAMDRAGHLGEGTVGAPIVYLLPPVTLWFTLETKMLNHMQVGTPFHPTWWCDGDLPEFSKTDWVNVTFGLATALITVVLTSYAFWAVGRAVDFSSFSLDAESTYKFAVAHGILFIFHSGIWMIVASSGVPPIGDARAFRMFPPELPPLIRASPHSCVPAHKVDLVIGHALLLLGALFVDDSDEQQEMIVKGAVCAAWAYTALRKVAIHYTDWGYKPKVEHKKLD